MPRRLRGTITAVSGGWQVAVPRRKGSPQRRTARFVQRQAAERWRAAAIAALEDGRPLPDPDDYRPAPRHARQGANAAGASGDPPTLEAVAWSWHAEHYEHFRRAAPGRAAEAAASLRRHLLPFFAGLRVDEIERSCPSCDNDYASDIPCPRRGRHREVKAFILHLAGRGETSVADVAAGGRGDAEGEVTVDQAAELCGVHRSSVKRWLRAGQLPGARIHPDTGRRMIPVVALEAAGKLGAASGRGLSRAYASDLVWMLRSILGVACTHGWISHNPADDMRALVPDPATARTPPPRERPRPLTLAECHAAAAHLHLPHQAAMWLQRLLGLRVAEAFGPRVGDLLDDGDHGLVVIRRQGGKAFLTRDDAGKVVTVDAVDGTKTAHSYRVLAVPATLMRLLRVLIAAYHTDPASGEIDLTARLIPGLREPDRGGVGAYTTALGEALRAVGLAAEHLGFRIGSHHLRKSLATDLAYADVDDLVQRRVLGHVAGHDVHARHYLLDTPASEAHLQVARQLDDSVEAEIGDLLVSTPKRPNFGRDHPIRQRLDFVEAVLAEAWGQVRGGDTEPLLGTRDVAELLGEPVTTVRRWMREGKLPTVTATDRFGAERRMVRHSDVQALVAEQQQRWTLPDAAEQLGVSYQEAWKAFYRLGLDATRAPNGTLRLDGDAVDALRVEFARIARLHERSVRVADAAREVRVRPDAIYKAIRRGELVQDPETDGAGARYVTRASLEAYRQRPDRARHAPPTRGDGNEATADADGDAVDLIPLRELGELTGLTPHQLKALADARRLRLVTRSRRTYVTRASVEEWASGYRPELLAHL